jgi:hypothetical protein
MDTGTRIDLKDKKTSPLYLDHRFSVLDLERHLDSKQGGEDDHGK